MPKKRKVINCETLEVYESISDLSRKLNISPQRLYQAIYRNSKMNNVYYDFFDDWIYRTDKDKEEYCYKNNIFFLKGKHKALPYVEKMEKCKKYQTD